MTLESAIDAAERARELGLCVGYASGVFDLFHQGHLSLLIDCRSRCDFLIVGVDSDAAVKSRKGPERPHDPTRRRVKSVQESGYADFIFSKECSADQFIGRLRPDRYFLRELLGPADRNPIANLSGTRGGAADERNFNQ